MTYHHDLFLEKRAGYGKKTGTLIELVAKIHRLRNEDARHFVHTSVEASQTPVALLKRLSQSPIR